MPRFAYVRFALSLLVVASACGAQRARAAEKTAAELLPPTTVSYIEINKPKDVVSFVFDSPLRKLVDQSQDFRKALDAPKFKEFLAVLGLVEQRADVKWREALESTTDGGVCIAYDAQTQGVVLLAKSANPKMTDAVRDALFSLVRDDAKNKGNPDPIESKDYRGLSAYIINGGAVANIGPWLMLTNKSVLGKAVADLYLDGGPSLGADHAFAEVHQAAGATSTVWSFVRLGPLRALAADNPVFDAKYKSDNPAAEFLIGGLLPILRKADYISASLSLTPGDIKLSIAAPVDLASIVQEKKFFFAGPGDGAAKPLRPEGTLLSVSMYRDGSALWQSGPDLFTESVATQMAQAESGLSTFFGGKSFGADVLGAFKPQIQLVAAKQDYKVAGVSEPALKLPGFALVLNVRGEQFKALRKQIRVGFQSAIALGNLDGAGKGRSVLEMQTEKRANADIQFATYDMTDKATVKDDGYLNFSPAMVISDKYMMLCSTRQIAEQLADLADKQGDATIDDNTFIQADGAAIAALIKQDREPLIAQNMLDKGHDRAAAEKEVDVLANLVNYVKEGSVRITPTAHAVQLDIDVKTPEK